MTVRIDPVHPGQVVSKARKYSLKREVADLQTEPGILFEQVARGAAERARIGPASLGKSQRQIEEPGVFGGCKPVTGIGAPASARSLASSALPRDNGKQ